MADIDPDPPFPRRAPQAAEAEPQPVPALAVDGRIMTENAAILVFLDRLFPAAGLLPAPVEFAPFRQRHLALQRSMLIATGRLRGDLRERLAQFRAEQTAAARAMAIAEHFRDRGKRVLLLVDSVTRFARALRRRR